MVTSIGGSSPVPSGPGSPYAEIEVLAVIDHLALGGAEMLLGRFATAAPRAGIRLRVAYLEDRCGSPAAESLRAAGVEPVNLEVSGRPGSRHFRVMRHHIYTLQPDVVHTHLGSADIVGGIASRSLGVPVVSTVHAVTQRRSGGRHLKDSILLLGQRYCASRVITVSESARRAYVARSWGMDGKVVRVYNGVDVAIAPGSGVAVRRELGVGDDDLLVGMISALRQEKGHDVAIATIARLRDRFPRLRLLIVGDGPHAAKLAQLAAPLGDHVILTGRRMDVTRVFDALDVCLHPSRTDALPTTLIEALATSVPVLATAVGGIPEIIDGGRTGELVSGPPTVDTLAEALGGLLANPDRRREFAEAGRQAYLERFTSDPWVHTTRAVYDAVLAETNDRRNRLWGQLRR